MQEPCHDSIINARANKTYQCVGRPDDKGVPTLLKIDRYEDAIDLYKRWDNPSLFLFISERRQFMSFPNIQDNDNEEYKAFCHTEGGNLS